MATSCFFCRNLLSDYIEDILPGQRRKELEEHLSSCQECERVYKDLCATMDLLKAVPPRPLSHEMAIQIAEALHPKRTSWLTRTVISRLVIFASVPLLIFASTVAIFPTLFPWITQFSKPSEESSYIRYFPLLQGATAVVEEQSAWLYARDPFLRSFWEEGGLSPEEFEKTFSVKLPKGEEQ